MDMDFKSLERKMEAAKKSLEKTDSLAFLQEDEPGFSQLKLNLREEKDAQQLAVGSLQSLLDAMDKVVSAKRGADPLAP